LLVVLLLLAVALSSFVALMGITTGLRVSNYGSTGNVKEKGDSNKALLLVRTE
jgi:hypothetical protein